MMIITAGLLFSSLILMFVSLWRLAAARRRLSSITTLSYSIADLPSKIPDIVMVDSPPLQFKVGKKTLYVQALTMAVQDIFITEYAYFLKQYSARLEGLKFYELDELKSIEDKTGVLLKAISLLSSADIRSGFIRVIQRVLLKDKRSNPDKIKIKEFLNNITPNQLAQIFYAIYAYNIGIEKKNLQAQLKIIGEGSVGDRDTVFPESTKNGESNQKSEYTPLFPDSPFLPQHLRNSTTGKPKKLTNEKNNE